LTPTTSNVSVTSSELVALSAMVLLNSATLLHTGAASARLAGDRPKSTMTATTPLVPMYAMFEE
jgi:hypothetical protein